MTRYRFSCLMFLVFTFAQLFAQGSDTTLAVSERTIIVRGDQQYVPFEFNDEQGQPSGFAVELFYALMDQLDLKYDFKLDDWATVHKDMENKDVDMAIGMIYSPQRAQYVDFGIPHCFIYLAIVSNDKDNYTSLEQLRGKEIIVQNRDRAHDYLIETGLAGEIIPVENIMQGLEMLSKGEHDAALFTDVTSSYLIEKENIKHLSVHKSEIEPDKYSIAVSKGNSDLLYMLNMGLYQLKMNGTYDEIYNKWLGIYEQHDIPKIYKTIALTLLLIFVLAVVFIIALRHQVWRMTKDLKEANISSLQLIDELKEENKAREFAEHEMAVAKKKAEESDKLKSAFLANLNHEIRTPVAAIKGFATLLTEEQYDENECQKYSDIIKQNADMLLGMLDEIIFYSKLQTNLIKANPQIVDVDNLLDDIYSSFNLPLYTSKLKLSLEHNNQKVNIFADKDKIRQILFNLLTNAIKYTVQGEVAIGYTCKGNDICFYVRDTGIGIPEGEINQLFTRFYRASNVNVAHAKGTGLGLSITKELVTLLDGEIDVKSVVNQGSTFLVTLPYAVVVS